MIKAGETWIARNGDRFVIDEVKPTGNLTPVRSGANHWYRDGKYWALDFKHGKDLIRKAE